MAVVAVAVTDHCVAIIVCGRHSCVHHCHDLWSSLFVAIIVMVRGRDCLWPS